MISRPLLIQILVPLVIFGLGIGIARMALVIYNLPSGEAPRRSDSTYVRKITESSPGMRDSFTIAGVEVNNKHWVIVEVKNKHNDDTLRALLYDPRHSAAYVQVVSAPSTRVSFDTLMTPAQLSPQKETEDDTTE